MNATLQRETYSVRDYTQAELDAILAEVDDRGFVVIPSVITAEEADRVREALEALLEKERTPAREKMSSQRIMRLVAKGQVFVDLMAHPLIVALWKRYLGDDVICSTWSGNTVYPGANPTGWHADYPYWSLSIPWPSGNLAAQTVWMLDDFTVENGATGVRPYTHRKLHPPQPGDTHDDAEIITGVRGSVLVANGAFWHTARPNTTDKPRSALLGMYMRPCCIPQEDMLSQIADIENPTDLVRQLLCEKQYRPARFD